MNAHMDALPVDNDAIREQFIASADISVDSEMLLVGAILAKNESIKDAWAIAKPDHFHDQFLAGVYEIAYSLIQDGQPANVATIRKFYPDTKKVGKFTVPVLLARLESEALSTDAAGYAQDVRDSYVSRKAMQELAEGIEALSQADISAKPYDKITHIRARLNAISEMIEDFDGMEREFADVFDTVSQQAADAMSGKAKTGIDPGFGPMLNLTGPWSGGQLIIIGGATKQGKTALAFQCAAEIAAHHPVWTYSGEMSAEEITRREIARLTKISPNQMKSGKLKDSELEMIVDARKAIARRRMVIQDRPQTLAQIRERLDRRVSAHGQCVAVVDYIALVTPDQKSYRMAKHEFCEYVTDGLKKIARALDIPIVALSQLKKASFDQVYQKDITKRLEAVATRLPRYSDLYGSVERDADHAIIPFRAEPLIKQMEPTPGTEDYQIWERYMEQHVNRAKLVLALSREAYFPKTIDVGWDGKTTSFIDLRQDEFGRTMF